MLKRKALAAALLVSALGAIPFAASADKVIVVDRAPPAAREEVVPAPRHGYVWAPGYWDYRHGHHVWVKGHWEKERHGMYWHPNRWEERDGKYVFQRGGWHNERYAANGDRDHDGVRNKDDRAPNNPNRQ